MAYTEYVEWKTGLTLYGKAKPLNATWATGIIAMTENGAFGEYSASTFVDATQYTIYVNLDGTPGNEANTDSKIAVVTPDSANITAILLDTATTIPAQITGVSTWPSSQASRVTGTTLTAYVGETVTWPVITPYDVDGSVLDTSAIALTVTVETMDGVDIETILDAALTKTSTTIQFTTAAATSNAAVSQKRWAARRDDTGVVVRAGRYNVESLAKGD